MMTRDTERYARAARLKWARKHAGYKSARFAALQNQWNENTYKTHESGVNGFDTDLGRQYAQKYKVDVAWLMTGQGVQPSGHAETTAIVEQPDLEGDENMIPIIGIVRAGGLVDFSNPGRLGMVSPPTEGRWKAIQIESDMSISPSYLGGDVLFYPEERFDPGEVTGKECTIASEGNVWVRKILPGGGPERWHLGSPNAEPMLNRPIDWASPITWVRK